MPFKKRNPETAGLSPGPGAKKHSKTNAESQARMSQSPEPTSPEPALGEQGKVNEDANPEESEKESGGSLTVMSSPERVFAEVAGYVALLAAALQYIHGCCSPHPY